MSGLKIRPEDVAALRHDAEALRDRVPAGEIVCNLLDDRGYLLGLLAECNAKAAGAQVRQAEDLAQIAGVIDLTLRKHPMSKDAAEQLNALSLAIHDKAGKA